VLVLSLGHTLALSVPMAVSGGDAHGFGQMARITRSRRSKPRREPLPRHVPVLVAASLLCGVMILFNNYVLPESNHRLAACSSTSARSGRR